MKRAEQIDTDTDPDSDADEGEGQTDRSSPAEASPQYGAPFVSRTFGGAFVWARAPGFVCTVLRIIERENVVISTRNRRNMHVMLTGGRALLEVKEGNEVERIELLPATPVLIEGDKAYRLLAMTEVELFTVYTPIVSAE